MNVSKWDLMARVAREVKRVFRQNRSLEMTPDYIAQQLLNDRVIYEAACTNGMSDITHTPSGKHVIEPDLDVVVEWVHGVLGRRPLQERTPANRTPYKLYKFLRWVRKTYYVTNNWMRREGKYCII